MAEAEDSGGVGRLSQLEANYLNGPSKSSTALSFEALLGVFVCQVIHLFGFAVIFSVCVRLYGAFPRL